MQPEPPGTHRACNRPAQGLLYLYLYQGTASCVIWISDTHISAYTVPKICTKFPTLLGIIFMAHNRKKPASILLSSATPDCWWNHGKNFVVESKCHYSYTNTYFVSNFRLWQVKHCYVSPHQVAIDTHTHYNCDICVVCCTELLQCFCRIGTSHKFLKPKNRDTANYLKVMYRDNM